MRLGEGRARPVEQCGVGKSPLDSRERRAWIDHVAIDRLAAEHERRRLERPRAGDPDVDDSFRPLLFEGASGLQRRLHRADPTTERLETFDPRELPLGGGDDEHRATLACGA